MSEKEPISEVLKRKFEPISDWRPSGRSEGRSVVDETLEAIQKSKDSLTKAIEPLTDDAKAKIKEMAAVLDEMAEKSSKEARSFLAKTLEGIAAKIKPD